MTKKKKIFLIILLVALIVIGGIGIYSYYKAENAKEYKTLLDSLKIEFKDNPVVEYGTQDFDETTFIDNYKGELTYHDELDTMVIGMKQLKFTVTEDHDKFGTVTRDSFFTANVKDTQVPIITFNQETVTLEYEAEFKPESNIKEVTDPVDGTLEYIVEGDVDTSKSGEYVLNVKAVDKNGNETTATYKVVVKEKKVVTTTPSNSNNKKPSTTKPSGGGNSGGGGSSGGGTTNKPTVVDNNWYIAKDMVYTGKIFSSNDSCMDYGHERIDANDGNGRFGCYILGKKDSNGNIVAIPNKYGINCSDALSGKC